MIPSDPVRIALLAVFGIACWAVFGAIAGVSEPWDAESYWTLAYPVLLVTSGLAGAWLRQSAWRAGLVLTMAQLPVMLVQADTGSMLLFALVLLAVLAVPAMLASGLGGQWVIRHG